MPRLTPEELGDLAAPDGPPSSPSRSERPPEARENPALESALAHDFHVARLDDPVAPLCLGAHPKGFDRTLCDYNPRSSKHERGKHPIGSWTEEAKLTPERLRKVFRSAHRFNVGIACGPSNVFVLDEDAKGELERFCDQFGIELPATYRVATGNGWHYYFKQPAEERIRNNNLRGHGFELDVKGDGGYVVGDGSRHYSGIVYRAEDTDALIADAPEDLLRVLRELSGAHSNRATSTGTTTPRRTQRKPTLSELLSNPPSRGGGETNDWLTRVAGHYVNKHRDNYDAYIDACRAAIALVDPNYESFDATVEFRWANEQRKPKVVALDDASLVDAVAEAFRSRWCWSGGHGWREWDGKIWASRTEPALVERVRTHMQEMYWKLSAANSDAGYAKQLGSLLSGARVRGVAGFLKGALEVDSLAFDNRPNLLNCRNGVVDLHTGDISAHDPTLLLTKITATDYLPGATHPDWDKALESVREGDRRWLQVRVGQALTGYRVTDELMPVLYGGGRNGKTTFLSSVQSAFGTHARAVSDRVLTARDSDHPTELTDLQGLRLAVIEELPEAVPLSVKRLKDTVGQPTITARKIAKDTVTWETTHALFLATNHKPRVNETDHGTWRRLALVRFPFVFDGKDGIGHLPGDPGLHDRMRRGDEGRAEAVLAWCVTGAMRWFKANRVFPPLPDQIVADTEEWRGESDVVVSYIADRLRFDAHAAIGTTDLLADLNSWLEARGKASWGDQLMTERFGTHERVTVHGVEKRKGRLASSGTRVYGRDGRELPRQPEQARLWWGVAFQVIDGAIGEVPW